MPESHSDLSEAKRLLNSRNYDGSYRLARVFLDEENHADLEALQIAIESLLRNHCLSAALVYTFFGRKYHPNVWQHYWKEALILVLLGDFKSAHSVIEKGYSACKMSNVRLRQYAYILACCGQLNPSIVTNFLLARVPVSEKDISIFSCLPGFWARLSDQVFNETQDITPLTGTLESKEYIFVSGLGRSGTSALGRLLNQIECIELYMELYPAFSGKGYASSMFTEEAISARLSDHRHADVNRTIFKSKHGISSFIGDKRPYSHFTSEATYDLLEGRVISFFIYRPLIDIARSFALRAANPSDKWSAEHSFAHAVLLWNATCRMFLDMHKRRPDTWSSFVFLDYRLAFTDYGYIETKIIDPFFSHCSSQVRKDIRAYIDNSSCIACKSREAAIDSTILDAISLLLDHDSHYRFMELAGLLN